MKPLSECKWEVRICFNLPKGFTPVVKSNDNAGLAKFFEFGHFPVSKTEELAKAHWEEFARVNNWHNWEIV